MLPIRSPGLLHFKEAPVQHQKVFGTFLQIGQVYGRTGKFDDELAGTECSERTARMKGDSTGLMRSSSSILLGRQQAGYYIGWQLTWAIQSYE